MTEKIDIKRLERELVSAVEADKKYWRENDAKFRAIHQKVATYEEFRDIVKASHLTPLERKDLMDAARKQPWNPLVSTGHTISSDPVSAPVQQNVAPLASGGKPQRTQDFVRHWKALKGQPLTQYRLLLEVGGDQLRNMFRVEIGILGEILAVLNECFLNEDAPQAASILSCLSETPRHSLSVEFLSPAERTATESLFRKLLLSQNTPALQELAKVYRVRTDSTTHLLGGGGYIGTLDVNVVNDS